MVKENRQLLQHVLARMDTTSNEGNSPLPDDIDLPADTLAQLESLEASLDQDTATPKCLVSIYFIYY